MIGRLREGWSDHALGHDTRGAFQPRGRIRQVFLAIAALHSIVSGRLARAAVCCALASLTRPEGAVLVALWLVALWRVR